jgi:hypothetical protein
VYAGKIYQKGVALKEMNQLGREIMVQLRTDIAAANTEKVVSKTSDASGIGRICLGSVSYVYNTADALNDTSSTPILDGEPIRLVRIQDPDSSWCEESGGVLRDSFTSEETRTELLRSDSVSLAVYDMELEPMLEKNLATGAQGLFRLSLRVGTSEAGTVADGQCVPPTDNQSDFEYCSVRDFDTIIRTRES